MSADPESALEASLPPDAVPNAVNERDQQFHLLADALPQLVWATSPDGMVDYLNRGWCEYTGASAEASFGTQWLQFLHPDDIERTKAAWREAVATASTYEVEYRLRNAEGEYRWMIARGQPATSASGAITRWIGTSTDVHEQTEAAERLEMLSDELSHRIKNIFAVISGLVSLTIRKSPEIAEAGRELQERILALGRAHDFVRSHRHQARVPHPRSSLKGLLSALLAPYQDSGGERIAITGADTPIDDRSATPLALFFHELATNAAKYGALCEPHGTVRIEISDDDPLVLSWIEAGGPPVLSPASGGFGGNLIEMSIARQLGGELHYDWRPAGLRVTARIPQGAMVR